MGGILGNIDNIFGPGGFLGGAPGDTDAQKAQAALLARMMGREGELNPELMKLLGDSTGNADAAYTAQMDGANSVYPGVQSDVSTLNMPPAALDALNKIRQERLSSIDSQTTKMIGSGVADYARRGMSSSSTAEGLGDKVGAAIAPTISQAEGDFYNARTTMPGEIAMKKYGLATAQGGLNSAALKDKYSSVLNPYLDMWKTSAGIGAQTPSTTKDPGQGGANLGTIASLFA
jgi:hypothetical protein